LIRRDHFLFFVFVFFAATAVTDPSATYP
jgi:hypothetical protein